MFAVERQKKIIEALSEKCGAVIDLPNGYEDHLSGKTSLRAFPTPEAILELGVDGLYELKTGFRAKYIYDAAEKYVNGERDLDKIMTSDTSLAIEMLCKVKGIGPKVASCALLFGFERYDAFPIDVWMKRAVEKYFPEYDKDSFSPSILGRYAGIAQQYLFYYERYLGGKEI
jgi:N-glycosylase/DNA lyase